ncbi:MAG: response regulator transcription factor [Solirubrobacteraceae bacterium]
MRILVVEDEPKMATLLRRGLEGVGFAVDVAPDGEEALWRAGSTAYDTILLDRRLPGIDGLEVCRRLRADEVWSPILMLTALGEVPDRVDGLNAGADDYLVKPFSLLELRARVQAMTRRGPVSHAPLLEVGDLRLDPVGHRVWRGDDAIALTAKEFALLETFMRHPNQVLTRFALLEHAWDGGYENRSNVVDVHVLQLRAKIDRPFGRDSLKTVRGVGYQLCDG